MNQPGNLFQSLPASLPEELIETLVESSSLRIERIVSHGHNSPAEFWYDQEEHEWVIVLQGKARLRFEEDRIVELNVGDHLLIPAHQRHRVEWTPPDELTVWLAVFYRDDNSGETGKRSD